MQDNSPKIDPNMKDYSNDPFFKEKKDNAKNFLENNPVPEQFLNRKVMRLDIIDRLTDVLDSLKKSQNKDEDLQNLRSLQKELKTIQHLTDQRIAELQK